MSTENPPMPPSTDLFNSTNEAINRSNLVLRSTDTGPASSLALNPELLSHVGDGIFLQTKTAQGLAGFFVWVALFITCQQVRDFN